MHFEWSKFCDAHAIHYVTKGPNTARNHISIQCPMCGDSDHSQHMGLSLDPRNPRWGCLRDPKHRGRDPTYLITVLLRCGKEMARNVVNAQRPELDAFAQAADRWLSKPKEREVTQQQSRELDMPSHFKPLSGAGYGPAFLEYLEERGFAHARAVAAHYHLHYSLIDQWQRRLIIPFLEDGRLVGWTGRSIDPRVPLRYLTLPADREAAQRLGCQPARVNLDEYVWRRDAVLRGGRALVIVEGPMDAIKLDWYKPFPKDVIVTCCFGMPKRGQVELLGGAARKYEKVVVMLDADAWNKAWELSAQIEELCGGLASCVPVLPEAKDPGAMTAEQVRNVLRRWA